MSMTALDSVDLAKTRLWTLSSCCVPTHPIRYHNTSRKTSREFLYTV